MEKINQEELLKDRRVVEEIHRHLWVESEKAGYDVGFEKAAEDWLKKFSKAWMEYYMPEKKPAAKKSSSAKSKVLKKQSRKKESSRKS